MADISASAVASLRSRTGVSMMLCKEALEEAGGDEEKAIEILRKSGAAQVVKKAGREQGEGAIFVATKENTVALLKLNCETDFVARNDDFIAFGQELADSLLAQGEDAFKAGAEAKVAESVQKLGENISLGEMHIVESDAIGSYVHSNRKIGVIVGLDGGNSEIAKDVAMHAAAMNPLYTSPEDVPAETVEKEKEIWKDQLKREGKPEEIFDKIMMGKEKKFREENALVSQDFVKEPGKKVSEHLDGAKVTEYLRVAV